MLPNLSSIIIVSITLNLAGNIGIESGLTYLGFGLPESTPSLGTLVSYATNPDVLQEKWWIWLPASIMILVLMLCINFIGQALKRSADARQKKRIRGGEFMNKPKLYKVLSTLAASTLLLSACGVQMAAAKTTTSNKQVDTQKFNAAVKNDKKKLKTDH